MKRLLIFALLGPLLGFVTGWFIMLPLFNAAFGDSTEFSIYQFVLLPLAYFMGLIPAVITAVFDESVAHRRFRILWTTLFAFGASFIPMLGAILSGFFSPWLLPFGFVGAVPGAICSWLAGPGTPTPCPKMPPRTGDVEPGSTELKHPEGNDMARPAAQDGG